MPSLKLSRLVRRDADRPSLKQRMAGLKATAGRVMRRPKPEAPVMARGLDADLMAMLGGIHNDDGTVNFCDAAGRVLHKPTKDWIAFTAARLHLQARSEMARQLNDPSLTEEARTALALELRRDLRVDALDILAARPREAFDAAQERGTGAIPKVRDYSGGVVSPDLMRATAIHREACRLMADDPDADDERFNTAHQRARALEAAAKAIPARSLADIRHKVLTLWPNDARDNVIDDDFAETLRCLREDVERLGGVEIYGDKSASLPEMPADAPADLADAYIWVVRHRAWMDSPRGPDNDAAMNVEIHKDNAIFARGIATPAASLRDLWGKARLALEDYERFRIEADEEIDDGIRFLLATLRDVVALCDPARRILGSAFAEQMIATWRGWGAIDDSIPKGSDAVAANERITAQLNALIDEAEALPATLDAVGAKALALAWSTYLDQWTNGQARDEYDYLGRLALDIDTAICGRLKTEYQSHG